MPAMEKEEAALPGPAERLRLPEQSALASPRVHQQSVTPRATPRSGSRVWARREPATSLWRTAGFVPPEAPAAEGALERFCESPARRRPLSMTPTPRERGGPRLGFQHPAPRPGRTLLSQSGRRQMGISPSPEPARSQQVRPLHDYAMLESTDSILQGLDKEPRAKVYDTHGQAPELSTLRAEVKRLQQYLVSSGQETFGEDVWRAVDPRGADDVAFIREVRQLLHSTTDSDQASESAAEAKTLGDAALGQEAPPPLISVPRRGSGQHPPTTRRTSTLQRAMRGVDPLLLGPAHKYRDNAIEIFERAVKAAKILDLPSQS